MADEPIKKEVETKTDEPIIAISETAADDQPLASATPAPVDFSEAGGLDPAGTKDPDRADPDPQADLSAEAEEISSEVIDGKKPEEKVAEEVTIVPTEEAKPLEVSEANQAAADFGVAPTPPLPAAVISEQPVATPEPQNSTASPVSVEEPNGPMPEELKHWNWGAFFWSWIWGIANNTWIALLALLGPLSIVMMIILGVKGNEYAWKNRKFQDLATFKKVQSAWAKWGLIVFIVYILMMVGVTVLVVKSLNSSTPDYDTTTLDSTY